MSEQISLSFAEEMYHFNAEMFENAGDREKLKLDIINEVLSETRIRKVSEPSTAISVMWDNIGRVGDMRELIRIGDSRWNTATSKYVRTNYDRLVELTKKAKKRYNERRMFRNKQEQIWIDGYLKERWRCPICGRAAPDDFCIVHSDVKAVDILKNEKIQVMVLEEAKLHGKRGLKEHVLEYLVVRGAEPFISEEWLAKMEKSGKTFYHIKPQIDAWIDDSFEMEERVKKEEEREEELAEETIPKEFDWLVKEAEKYKTAEAFQKAQYAIKPIPNTALGIETGLINWGVIPKSEDPHVLRVFWNLVHDNAGIEEENKNILPLPVCDCGYVIPELPHDTMFAQGRCPQCNAKITAWDEGYRNIKVCKGWIRVGLWGEKWRRTK